MNVRKLQENRQIQEENLVEIYRGVIDKLWTKIQNIDISSGPGGPKNYIYEVPNFVVGEPQYDREVAFQLIKRRLIRGGFQIQSLIANNTYFIYIDWEAPTTNSKKKKKRTS